MGKGRWVGGAVVVAVVADVGIEVEQEWARGIEHQKLLLHTLPDPAQTPLELDNPSDPEVIAAGNTLVVAVAVVVVVAADVHLKEAHTSPSSNRKPLHPYTHPSLLLSIRTLHHHRLRDSAFLRLQLRLAGGLDPNLVEVDECEEVEVVDDDVVMDVGSSGIVMRVRLS